MNKYAKSLTTLILAAILILASGCSAPKPAGLSDQQVASVTENTLKAIDTNDYAKFTQSFSDKMSSAFTQDQFSSLRKLLQGASGSYISLGAPSLTNNQGYAVYRYPAKYSNETVFVTITFLIGGTQIEGLFFDSVNLRKAPK